MPVDCVATEALQNGVTQSLDSEFPTIGRPLGGHGHEPPRFRTARLRDDRHAKAVAGNDISYSLYLVALETCFSHLVRQNDLAIRLALAKSPKTRFWSHS